MDGGLAARIETSCRHISREILPGEIGVGAVVETFKEVLQTAS